MEKSSRGYDVCTFKRNYAGVRSKRSDYRRYKKSLLIQDGIACKEVAPDAVSIEKVAKFTVADVLTNESFAGYSLEEKAEKMNAEGDLETAIIIRNLY